MPSREWSDPPSTATIVTRLTVGRGAAAEREWRRKHRFRVIDDFLRGFLRRVFDDDGHDAMIFGAEAFDTKKLGETVRGTAVGDDVLGRK